MRQTKRHNTQKLLKYGDFVLISSKSLTTPSYYAARSLTEENVKVVSQKTKEKLGISGSSLCLYPNFNELIFKIYPKLNYDTLMEFKKLKPSDHRYELLQRRLEADDEMNERIVEEFTGKPVRYGDTIQLYHDLTESYVKVSFEKEKKRNLFKLKLTDEGCDEVHLNLLPGMSLKKEGQFVSYEDFFLFVNQKTQMTLVFPKEGKTLEIENRKEGVYNVSKKKTTEVEINPRTLPKIQNLPICEQSLIFDLEDAFATNISSRFQRRMTKDIKNECTSYIKCHLVNYCKQKERKDLRYGDYIQLQSTGLNRLTKGLVVCETNFSGFSPEIKYRIVQNAAYQELISFDSIFQIVPQDIAQYGQTLSFKGQNSCSLSLKHFLSSRMLTFTPSGSKEEGFSPVLSEDFYSYANRWLEDPANRDIINEKKREEENIKESVMKKSKSTQSLINGINQNEQLLNIISKNYFNEYSIKVIREAAADEEQILLTSNLLQISDNNDYILKVKKTDADIYTVSSTDRKCEYYQHFYHKVADSDFKTYAMETVQKGSVDTFFMLHVSLKTISRIIHYVSCLTPIISISERLEISPDGISEAEGAVKKIKRLLDHDYQTGEALEKGVYSKQVQSAIRELGIFDLCMNLLYFYNIYIIEEHSDDFVILLNNIVNLMATSCRDNYLNCYYLFQWHKLFSAMIMGTATPKRKGMCSIHVDRIVSVIFEITEFNRSVTSTIDPLLERHSFQKYDLKCLNLLFALIKTPKNGKRSVGMLDTILNKILRPNNFRKIFRPFVRDKEGIHIEIDRISRVKIDDQLQKEVLRMDYIKRNIELATELCKEFPVLFLPQYETFISEKLCLSMIADDNLNSNLKSSLVQFYIASYLSAKCQSIPRIKGVDYLKIREEDYEDKFSKANELIRNRILNDMFIEDKHFNLKSYIYKYLQNPANYIQLQPRFLESLLDLIIYLIQRGFLTVKEIADLKYSLFHFIKFFISATYTNKFKGLADFLVDHTLNRKNSNASKELKDSFMDVDDDSVMNFEMKEVTISERHMNFVSKMIDCLSKLEELIYDLRFEHLIHEDESKDFFSLKDIQKEAFIPQDELNNIIDEKITKRENFMLRLSREVASPPTHFSFTLLDFMTMGSIEVSQRSLKLLIKLYEVRYKFMKDVPYIQLVLKDGVMDEIIWRYLKVFKDNFEAEGKINTIRNPELNLGKVVQIYCDINNNLTELISDILMPIEKDNGIKNKAKALVIKHNLMIDLKIIETKNESQGVFVNLFNEVLLNMDKLDLKQTIIKNINIIDQVFRILRLCNESYIHFATDYKKKVGGQYFSNSMLFGKNDNVERNAFLRNEVIVKCLIILIYTCLKNPDNQIYMREKLQTHLRDVFSIVYDTNEEIIKYFLALLAKIYGENLTLLVKIPQNDQMMVRNLADQFYKRFKNNRVSSIYTMMTLFSLSRFKELNIVQNQTYVSEIFKEFSFSKKSNLLVNYFSEKLLKYLTLHPGETHALQHPYSQYLNQGQVKVIMIPDEITFSTIFFKNISEVCENKDKNLIQDNQLFVSTNTIKAILFCKTNWWKLKTEILNFLRTVYLEGDIEESDWDVLTEISLELIEITKDYKSMVESYDKKNMKLIYIDSLNVFPKTHFVKSTNDKFDHFYSEEYKEAFTSYLKTGLIPFVETYVTKMPNTGSRHEREILAKLSKKLKKSNKRGKGNVFSLFKRDYMGHVKAQGADFAEDNFENDETVIKTKMERNKILKKEIYRNLTHFENNLEASSNPNDSYSDNTTGSELKELNSVLYYNYWVEEENEDGLITRDEHYNFNSNFIHSEFYERLRQEDTMLLVDHILGLKHANQLKFISILKILFIILGDVRENTEAKANSIKLLRALIKEAREKNTDIIMDMIENNAVEILCRAIIRNSSNPENCVLFIKLSSDILEEEEREIQERFFNYMTALDPNNELIISMKDFLTISYERLKNSEQLRSDVMKSMVSRNEDLMLVANESLVNMDSVISGLEFLRLMCEGHFSPMQNFLREQVVNGMKKVNSINMILVVTDILIHYKSIVDDTNIQLGNQIFTYFIELLQGPCIENQAEICKTKLLETVEDMLIDLVKGGKTDKSLLDGVMSIGPGQKMPMSEYTKSGLIRNILEFMSAIIEASQDNFIISKVSIHVNQDMFINRMVNIYKIFYQDINKNFMGAFADVINRKGTNQKIGSAGSSGGLQRSATSGSKLNLGSKVKFQKTDAEEGAKQFKVLVDNKKNYNPIILEGIMLWTLLQTICDLEDSFKTRLKKLVAEINQSGDVKDLNKTVEFFKEKTASIEIFNSSKNIQKIYFPIQNVTRFLSEYTRKKFEENVNRESANDKIKGCLQDYNDFYDEMTHFQKLRALGIPVNLTYFEYLKNISLLCVVAANIILLLTDTSTDPQFGNSIEDRLVQFLGYIIMIIYMLIMGLWLVFNSHIDIKKTHRMKYAEYVKISRINSPFIRSMRMFGYFRDFGFSLLVNTYLLDLGMNITFAILGVFASKLFFSFMLLDIIGRSEILKNVIRAVTLNISQFLQTLILVIVFLYIFTSITYFSYLKGTMIFVDETDFSMCSSFFHCFLTMIGFGMRSGGGIGENIMYPDYETEQREYIGRFVNDFIFFITISIIFLNILFGIIIDTFAELRDKKNISGKPLLVNQSRL